MEFGQRSELKRLLSICKRIVPERVSLLTNYGTWEDWVVMRGPHLSVSVKRKKGQEEKWISISDERGMSVLIPCEGVEIVEVHKTEWDFEAHVYFFTFEGFARMNIIGKHMHQLTGDLELQKEL